ncbi:DUF2793 domain-containing protein [Clostridium botulinum]|nr:DUF2793 domain-containing protein [Clostridium botulinum]
MAQTILIKRGNKNNLPTLKVGEFAFCVDTKEVYIGDGSTNNFVGRCMSGTETQRPNAGSLGRFYRITSGNNAGYLFFDNGSVWERINAQKLTDLEGTIDDIKDGSTYAKIRKTDVSDGHVNKVSDGTNTTSASEIRTHINDATKHRIINDSNTSTTELWSSQKTNTEIYNAIRGLEWQDSAKNRTLTIPPTSNTKGDRYVIPSNATGVWSGKTNQIAHFNDSSWEYYVPELGWSIYVDNENKNYVYNGSAWVRSGEANQNIAAGNGLTGGGQGDSITLTIGQGNGITVSSTSISAKPGKGVTVDGNGINANVDGNSVIIDGNNKIVVGTVDGGTF